MNNNWFEIKNKADVTEIAIYDEIGHFGITAKQFIDEFSKIESKNINISLNSPGGSVFDGVAIHNVLKKSEANIVIHIDGLAASIASIIAIAGDEVHMAKNALFMIHNPYVGINGEASSLRKMADNLDKIKETLMSSYEEKTGLDRGLLSEMMDEETWFTADEAKENKFVDFVEKEKKIAAFFDAEKYGFKNSKIYDVQKEEKRLKKEEIEEKKIEEKAPLLDKALVREILNEEIQRIRDVFSEVKDFDMLEDAMGLISSGATKQEANLALRELKVKKMESTHEVAVSNSNENSLTEEEKFNQSEELKNEFHSYRIYQGYMKAKENNLVKGEI
ncbi:hypothetical protein AB834_00495 [PVC group bacterium (ex Bugula neritina AB1)]|nr:hypothetical protein AB834_00495 [PVC group bacterium (ex Bugula neritina AB1)]